MVAWHRSFCVDLEESTFAYLRNFLESYCDGIGNDVPPAPFLTKRYSSYAVTRVQNTKLLGVYWFDLTLAHLLSLSYV